MYGGKENTEAEGKGQEEGTGETRRRPEGESSGGTRRRDDGSGSAAEGGAEAAGHQTLRVSLSAQGSLFIV